MSPAVYDKLYDKQQVLKFMYNNLWKPLATNFFKFTQEIQFWVKMVSTCLKELNLDAISMGLYQGKARLSNAP